MQKADEAREADESRLIELAGDANDEEVTIYVKGFLGRNEAPKHFDAWLGGHEELVDTLAWGSSARGYHWEAGNLRKLALPVASGAKTVWDLYRLVRHTRAVNPLATAGWFIAEQAVGVCARFIAQFIEARKQAELRAHDLADEIERLTREGRQVRVVAHSLGCRQAIEAAAQLPEALRPRELHLCAPACLEEEIEDKLDAVAGDSAYLYYTELDQVLEISFRAMSQGRAIGAAGLSRDYEGLVEYDVSEAFDFWVHTEYKNRFASFLAPDDESELAEDQETS
ncbi:MAG: hypothetical protein QF570_03980 [Myxococcota bacterium]|nr:hypothetical protein [Myxococcota bacterium]